jgi:hypothetical protein
MSHDQNFKNLILDYSRQALEFFAPEQRVEVYLRAQEGLAELEPDLEKRLKYIDFIAQYASLNEIEQAQYERYLAQSAYKEAIMGPIQKAREEGIRQGIQQQILEGIQLGLELKFGTEGLQLVPEIRKIQDLNVLKAIHEGLKSANRPEELQCLYQGRQETH